MTLQCLDAALAAIVHDLLRGERMTGWKLWTRRVAALIVFVIFLATAICAAGLVPYALAAQTASIIILTLSSILSFALIVWTGARVAAAIWPAAKRSGFPAWSTGILAAVFVVSLYLIVLRPVRLRLSERRPYADTRYWQLTTGSRIAYSEFDPPAGMTVKPYPIVFLHGGPGVVQAPFDQEIYGSFAADGFRVFLFDQAGSGLSAFLPRVRDYTVTRSVNDLEAIRKQIGAEKMILIGHSWGSTLAASYMAKYPGRVAKVVFHSPGSIWNLPETKMDYSRTESGSFRFPSPRLLAALLLRDRNPDAAQNLLPQREAEELTVPIFAPTVKSLVCKGDSARLPQFVSDLGATTENPGFNMYVLQELIPQTDDPKGDPHRALRSNHTPAILLYPECNYLPWSDVVDYRRTLPNLKVYYVPRAGHYIQFEQPELLRNIIRAFLLDQPDAVPAYESDTDPRTK